MYYFLSQKHRHLEARKQIYKLVLEHEIESTVISLQVLVAFLISLQRQKWQHPGAQSSSMGIATWSPWLLKLRLAAWRHARVSCCSGTEQSFGQIHSKVWMGTQSWLNSLSLPSSALHVSAVGVDAAVSWRRWDLGLGGTAMPGSAGKKQQVWQDNFQSRLKW